MKMVFTKTLNAIWYKPRYRWLAYTLLPLSAGYYCAYLITRHIHKNKFFSPVPVIVIGNFTVGGTGKTPILISLAKFLQEKGYKVGIISRGYNSPAASAQHPVLVSSNHTALDVGDEPLLLYQETACPIAVHANRPAAIKTLLKMTEVDLILSDDGLQNCSFQHDIEIAVIDGLRGFGNGFLLPAGPLREPLQKRLTSIDFRLLNTATPAKIKTLQQQYKCSVADFQFKPKYFKELHTARLCHLDFFQGQKIHAVTGIGHPQRFFDLLKTLGIFVICHPFPDHYNFTLADFKTFATDVIIMTTKDAVKCRNIMLTQAYVLEMEGCFPPLTLDDFLCKVQYSIIQKHKENV